MTAHVIRGDARTLPLPDASVDLIVTSPPYFALRSYQDDGEHYDGQIGAEPTPTEYVDGLIACTAEWARVLKPSGSLWVNLGDVYANRSGVGWGRTSVINGRHGLPETIRNSTPHRRPDTARASGIREKSLMGLPWRYALRCIDELGLILRSEVVWSKPNGLPESVTDRVRRSHEQWFHFTREPRYFTALDELREGYAPGTAKRYAAGYNERAIDTQRLTVNVKLGGDTYAENPLGRMPGSVWSIPTEALKVPEVSPLDGQPLPDHYASFPTEWPRRIILGFTPPGAAVLDPMGGSGTTALVASVLGRVGISVDRSHGYCRVARWRTTDPGERARAMRVDKPPVQAAGQESLFEVGGRA